MVQVFLKGIDHSVQVVDLSSPSSVDDICLEVSQQADLSLSSFSLFHLDAGLHFHCGEEKEVSLCEGSTLYVRLPVRGGIDFQHREGGKTGSGGQLSESQAALERKERLRKLALETIDITKDPYFMRNHLGTFECKLCLTLHPNEGNYLAHTQGKRHQYNLGRRAAMEAKNAAPRTMVTKEVPVQRTIRIGRPGYKVTKSRDLLTRQRALLFEVDYPEVESGAQPRHRFMSAFEQKIEAPDKNYQYLLFACDPYETIAFKIPNQPIDKREGRFVTNWDKDNKKFALQLFFLDNPNGNSSNHSSSDQPLAVSMQ
eukprot:gene10534-11671_t